MLSLKTLCRKLCACLVYVSQVNDCLDHSSSPIDGATLTETMHTRGINMRYLGKVAETFAKYKSVSYVYVSTHL